MIGLSIFWHCMDNILLKINCINLLIFMQNLFDYSISLHNISVNLCIWIFWCLFLFNFCLFVFIYQYWFLICSYSVGSLFIWLFDYYIIINFSIIALIFWLLIIIVDKLWIFFWLSILIYLAWKFYIVDWNRLFWRY